MSTWYASEIAALRRLAKAPLDEVCAALPRHTRGTIMAAFCRHRIVRRVEKAAAGGGRHPLMGQIVAARKARGWSQAELAARAGLDRAALSTLERGHHRPNLVTLEKLASALGMKVVLVGENGGTGS